MHYLLMALSATACIVSVASKNYTTAGWALAYFFSRLEVLGLQRSK